jgi:predicted alpha/beta-fold hydrolase
METYKQKLKVDIDKFFEDKDLSTIDIEEKIIAPSFGFKSRNEYHEKASCINSIPLIKLPTIYLHTKDDPVYG